MLKPLRSVNRLVRSWFTASHQGTICRKRASVRPLLEFLEDRLAPATGLASSNQQLLQSYGNLPISFEANAGQTDAAVQYLARGNGYALFLTSTSAVLDLEKASPTMTPSSAPLTVTGSALAMNLIGANSEASAVGLDQLPGTSNYFIGNDSSKWRTNIANYGQVAYQDVYPGINVVYYGNQQQLEYDFLVAPGPNLGNIRLGFQGSDSISLDEQGNLVIATAAGNVLEHAPVAYQEVGGSRQAVAGQFVLLGPNQVGFQVGAYDPTLPLTIDPVLSYSTFIGGNNDDVGEGIQVDSAGNAYITGYTTSTNFPTTTGANQTSFGGSFDAFVTKLNAAGTAAVYSTFLGGSDFDGGLASRWMVPAMHIYREPLNPLIFPRQPVLSRRLQAAGVTPS